MFKNHLYEFLTKTKTNISNQFHKSLQTTIDKKCTTEDAGESLLNNRTIQKKYLLP